MLGQFSFSNFKAFRYRTVLDFRATQLPEFTDSLLTGTRGELLLPVSAVFGANGGGKSTVLQAFRCLLHAAAGGGADAVARSGCAPFLYDERCSSGPSDFEVYFHTGGREYRYILGIQEGAAAYESLHWKDFGREPVRVFAREGALYAAGERGPEQILPYGAVPDRPLLPMLAATGRVPEAAEAVRWLRSCISVDLLHPPAESPLQGSGPRELRAAVRALNSLGAEISGLRTGEDGTVFVQRTAGGRVYEMDLREESDGVQRLVRLIPAVQTALREGRLLTVDDLDAGLHPMVVKYLAGLFADRRINTRGAQLLFTCRDTALLDSSVFRRDEIWFSDVGEDFAGTLVSLSDFRNPDGSPVSTGSSWAQDCLKGKFGAVPYLRGMLTGGVWT